MQELASRTGNAAIVFTSYMQPSEQKQQDNVASIHFIQPIEQKQLDISLDIISHPQEGAATSPSLDVTSQEGAATGRDQTAHLATPTFR